jgi:hypothetical protein
MIGSAGTAVFSDNELQDTLDQYRTDVYRDLVLFQLSYDGSGTAQYIDAYSAYGNYEETTGGTAGFILQDTAGSAIGTANYEIDYIRGKLTFGTTQAGSARYIVGRSYNLHAAAAELWRELAGTKAELYDFRADGHNMTRSQWFDHCIEMSEHYDLLAGPQVGTIYRDDVIA